MCYKEEKHKKILIKMEKELRDVPNFISNFFVRYKSAVTKKYTWGFIRALLNWLIGKQYIQKNSLAEITPEDIQRIIPEHIIEYFQNLQNGIGGQANSLESINTKKNVFSAFWSYLVKRKYVQENIIRDEGLKVRFKPEKKERDVKVPTEEQLEEFISNLYYGNNNEFNIIRNVTIVKVFLGSGIRSEELINLDLKDLYLEGGKRTNGKYTDKPFINVLGKGNIETYESVFISQEAKHYLEEYLQSRELLVKENNVNDNALFLSNEKRRISKGAIDNLFKKYSNNAINPHMLRHWMGTELYNKTKDIVLVQKQLRHSSLETAAKYYVHIDEDSLAEAIENI